jgi:allantoinase
MTTLKDTPTTLMFHAEMQPTDPLAVAEGTSLEQFEAAALQRIEEPSTYAAFLESRPPTFEICAVEEILSMASLAPRLHLHIVHLSATECIPLLRKARQAGINITAETCFHYLGLAADDIPDGDTRHKCCPPIRSQTNQDRLWDEISDPDSCIKTIVSDHSPCTPELKLLPPHLERVFQDGPRPAIRHFDSGIDVTMPEEEIESKTLQEAVAVGGIATEMVLTTAGLQVPTIHHSDSSVDVTMPEEVAQAEEELLQQDEAAALDLVTLPVAAAVESRGDFFAAWGGISSVGLGLPILHTTAKERAARGDAAPSMVDIVRMCCQATARQVGLAHRKGGLRVGMDADICVFDEAHIWTLQASEMRWKNRCSPWEGHTFTGRVQETWLRGRKVFQLGGENAGLVGGRPIGEAIVEKRMV